MIHQLTEHRFMNRLAVTKLSDLHAVECLSPHLGTYSQTMPTRVVLLRKNQTAI
jgi:hypothetical protein